MCASELQMDARELGACTDPWVHGTQWCMVSPVGCVAWSRLMIDVKWLMILTCSEMVHVAFHVVNDSMLNGG